MTTSRTRSSVRSRTEHQGNPRTTMPHEASCWRAVTERDRAADGSFVYAVGTTGIYCRPSCPARRPHRRNVRFFATPAEAGAAGFRPCKRCQPTSFGQSDVQGRRVACVTETCRRIESSEEMPCLTELARLAGLSTAHFHRTFKSLVGVTPKQYATAVRAERLRQALPASPTVTAAVHGAGYMSTTRFYAEAQEVLGMSPKSYRSGGAGEVIRHVGALSSLGLVLIASSAQGICAVLIGDNMEALRDDLARRFPRANLVEGDATLAEHVEQILTQIDKPGRHAPGLPIDLRGTAFQMRVWDALRKIPTGDTVSYGELARSIGAPRAVRAVAAACGANPVAVLVPCHRAVGANGAPTGYRWGIERKKTLLESEAAAEKKKKKNNVTTKARSPRT
ncbi:MAG: bifunctional DNA-binding transcriptional regulator/O6-methylguanine-DNA methyltransferase Ada [Hyphomicrobiaceae bacterium]